jgi:hypothetical protein
MKAPIDSRDKTETRLETENLIYELVKSYKIRDAREETQTLNNLIEIYYLQSVSLIGYLINQKQKVSELNTKT